MKNLNIMFTDEEFKKLQKAKKKYNQNSWRLFLLTLAKGVSVKKELKGGKAK